MIPSWSLGSLPRADPLPGGADAARFAQLEYGGSASWMLPRSSTRTGLLVRVVALLGGSLDRKARTDRAAEGVEPSLAEGIHVPTPTFRAEAVGYALVRDPTTHRSDPVVRCAP